MTTISHNCTHGQAELRAAKHQPRWLDTIYLGLSQKSLFNIFPKSTVTLAFRNKNFARLEINIAWRSGTGEEGWGDSEGQGGKEKAEEG